MYGLEKFKIEKVSPKSCIFYFFWSVVISHILTHIGSLIVALNGLGFDSPSGYKVSHPGRYKYMWVGQKSLATSLPRV